MPYDVHARTLEAKRSRQTTQGLIKKYGSIEAYREIKRQQALKRPRNKNGWVTRP